MGALWDAKRRCMTAAIWAVWFGFGLAYYGVTLLVTRIYDYTEDDDDLKCKFRYWQIFVFGCLYVALGSITAASSITWVHITELYPTEIRSTGHTAAFVVARVGAF